MPKQIKIPFIPWFFRNIKYLFTNNELYSEYITYPPDNKEELWKRRSIRLRHLDCGSCNGCELSLQRLNNPVIDIQKYNINFEASPRHAYSLVMTGPFVLNLEEAALKTLHAMPVEGVVLFGACAIDGGIFKDTYVLAGRPPEFEHSNNLTDNNSYPSAYLEIHGCPPKAHIAQEGFLMLDDLIKKRLKTWKR